MDIDLKKCIDKCPQAMGRFSKKKIPERIKKILQDHYNLIPAQRIYYPGMFLSKGLDE